MKIKQKKGWSMVLHNNRITKLQQTKRICEICGEEGEIVHHKDHSKDNHEIDNLIVVCRKCHWLLHPIYKTNSKYYRLYGMTLQDMVDRFGGTQGRYSRMHKRKVLKRFFADKNVNLGW